MTALTEIRQLVDEQAEDEGLWFVAKTENETHLQMHLRRLHALVEHFTTDNNRHDALDASLRKDRPQNEIEDR